jgi:hypothetical protein
MVSGAAPLHHPDLLGLKTDTVCSFMIALDDRTAATQKM